MTHSANPRLDPLVMDVLCDMRTRAYPGGRFVRSGVEYVFTMEEVALARDELLWTLLNQSRV